MRSSRWLFLLWLAALIFVHRYLFAGTVEAGRDLFRLFIPESAYLRERLLKGELPLWIPNVRLGMPFAATMYSEVFYPPRVLFVLLLGPVWGVQASIVFHAGLASLGAYLASRKLGAGRWGAVLAGAFGFTPFFTRLACSLHVVSSLAWSGFIVAAALLLARRPSVRSAALLAVPLGLSLLCGCPEMLIWQAALALGLAFSSRQPKRALAFCALAIGWCVALAAVVALPAAELSQFFRRPGQRLEDAFSWSTAPAQLLSMFWPFAEEKRALEVWGRDQWFATSLFVGAVPGLLALFALRKDRRVAALAAVGTVCAVLCLGRHFLPAKLVLELPPFSLFRYPVKYAFGLAFCIALLSGQGLRRLTALARRVEPRPRNVAIALGVGMLLLGVLQALAGLAPWREGMKPGALWFGFSALLVGLAFAILSGGWRGGRRVRTAVIALALGEVAVAQVTFGYVALVPADKLILPGALATKLGAQKGGRASIWVEDLDLPKLEVEGGKSRDYPLEQFVLDSRENLIALRPVEDHLSMVEGYGFRDWARLVDVLDDDPRGPYDVFGVTHYVRHGKPPYPDLEPPEGAGYSRAFRSSTAFPRAWVVHQAIVATDKEALEALRTKSQALRQRVFLAEGEAIEEPACDSSVRIEHRSDEKLELHVEACARGYVVLADSFFPGWVAHVGDVEQPIRRADYLLRAVQIPKGSSIVRMEYRPAVFRWGAALSVLGWLGVVGVVLGPRARSKFLKLQD